MTMPAAFALVHQTRLTVTRAYGFFYPRRFLMFARISTDGATIFEHACKLGLEGIVCRRIDVSYGAGRSIKLKNRARPSIMRVKEAFEEERRRSQQRFLGRRLRA